MMASSFSSDVQLLAWRQAKLHHSREALSLGAVVAAMLISARAGDVPAVG